jgi:hypothetical protein
MDNQSTYAQTMNPFADLIRFRPFTSFTLQKPLSSQLQDSEAPLDRSIYTQLSAMTSGVTGRRVEISFRLIPP